MLVRDFLDLPDQTRADDFIVRPDSSAAELARTYTLTSGIRTRLDTLLREIGQSLAKNQDIGRFIYGSFGSGKSHFLRIAAMMLGNDATLYTNARDQGIHQLRNDHAFLETANLLVVEASMVGVTEEVTAFTRHLAKSFDEALERAGKTALRSFGTAAVFAEFDRLCTVVPETFDRFSAKTGYDRAFYERQRADAVAGKDVSAFARDLARFFAGDERSFVPTENEARRQMSEHAAHLGYRGVVFVIDEFILWAQGLSGTGYVGAVNALNALVESADVRPVRFTVLAAIQRSIMDVFPDDASQKVLLEQLARVKDRFPQVYLEDSNLFEIAERRVLAPLPARAEEWRREVATTVRELTQTGRSVLVGDEPAETLVGLYPFHPALLRILSDVSQGLHRARSSLFMLYQLLVELRPTVEIGQIISLGALWDVLFSAEHVANLEGHAPKSDPNHRANLLLKTYGTWERLRGRIAEVGTEAGGSSATVLDLVVKSALLAQLSHTGFLDGGTRGLDRAITIENLLRLNRADIPAMNDRAGVLKIESLITKLATAEPGSVIVDGQGATAIVRIELNAIDLTELLVTLRPPSLFSTLLAEVKTVLGFGAGISSGLEAKFSVPLRANDRSGRVRFERFDNFTASGKESTLAVDGSDEFKLAILIENDVPGAARDAIDNTKAKIEAAREQNQSWAAAWLPEPLTAAGRDALETLAKVEMFEAKTEDFLGRFRAADHVQVKQSMGGLKISARTTLQTALRAAYGSASRVHTMRKEPAELFASGKSDVGERAKLYAVELLERRYPQYPRFTAVAGVSALNRLIALDRRLIGDPSKNILEGDDIDVARKLGEPLELFEPGVGVANIKSGGLYLERLRQAMNDGERNVGKLIARFANEPFGLQRPVVQALIAIIANRDGYRLTVDARALAIAALGDVDPRAELTRGTLVPLDVWNAARKAASGLFAVGDVPIGHNIGTQDALIAMLREPISRGRDVLRRCTVAFDTLDRDGSVVGKCAVRETYVNASKKLAAIDDEAKIIEGLAALDLEPYVATLKAAMVDSVALEELVAFENRSVVTMASPELKSSLEGMLARDVTPVAPDIKRWLGDAKTFVAESVKRAGTKPAVPAPTPPPPTNPPPGGPTSSHALVGTLRADASAAEIESVLATVRSTIEDRLARGRGAASIEVIVRDVGSAS